MVSGSSTSRKNERVVYAYKAKDRFSSKNKTVSLRELLKNKIKESRVTQKEPKEANGHKR